MFLLFKVRYHHMCLIKQAPSIVNMSKSCIKVGQTFRILRIQLFVVIRSLMLLIFHGCMQGGAAWNIADDLAGFTPFTPQVHGSVGMFTNDWLPFDPDGERCSLSRFSGHPRNFGHCMGQAASWLVRDLVPRRARCSLPDFVFWADFRQVSQVGGQCKAFIASVCGLTLWSLSLSEPQRLAYVSFQFLIQ